MSKIQESREPEPWMERVAAEWVGPGGQVKEGEIYDLAHLIASHAPEGSGQWVSVDSPPDIGKRLWGNGSGSQWMLTYGRDGFCVASLVKCGSMKAAEWLDFQNDPCKDVTHWMMLPNPPTVGPPAVAPQPTYTNPNPIGTITCRPTDPPMQGQLVECCPTCGSADKAIYDRFQEFGICSDPWHRSPAEKK
jgi:hypothetical protein